MIKKIKLSKNMNVSKLIDHTNIDIKATSEDIKKTCKEAIKYGFRGVDVRSKWVGLVKKELNGTDIKVVVLIDPPMGLSSHRERIRVCKKAKINGADELDVVMNIVDLKYERYGRIINDLKAICKILPTKVIIGSGYLTDQEVKKASEIVKKAGAFCVKTATEKDPLERRELEEKAEHLKIMAKAAPGLSIKASAKIKTLEDVKQMIKAGADIIGTSSGVEIMKIRVNGL
ncbi:deoxyribose-phosphate aldolase [Patescibacteria group bacterium]|nr:deoxyribose-phosphate aldolase [Patescibacteria group bacterium]